MFALDPPLAAREMHRVLRPTGRIAVVVWGARVDNPWLGLLLDATADVTGHVVPPPGLPGPFALSVAGELRDLFTRAGFTDLTLERVAAPLRAPSFDAWWNRNLTVAGPVVAVLERRGVPRPRRGPHPGGAEASSPGAARQRSGASRPARTKCPDRRGHEVRKP